MKTQSRVFTWNVYLSCFQAFVKINFEISGYAEIALKNEAGSDIYPKKKIPGNFWWDGSKYYKAKWGLYRAKSTKFNPSDYIFFQNVQIWKK